VSVLAMGTAPGSGGVLLAHPLLDPLGAVKGAVVLNVAGSAVSEILDPMRHGDQMTPFLIDGDGVIVHHPSPDRLHRSLAPLSAAQQAAVAAERRYGRDRIASLDETELARAMVGARRSGHVAYRSTVSGTEEIAGYAPVHGQAWVIGLAEPRAAFEAPLHALYQRLYGILAVVGLLVAGLGLAMARSLVRPIRALTDGAKALEGGDFERAKVAVRSGDEVGQLARTFNVMVEVLQQRERDLRDK
jgi:HAMP domain-containing protein